MLAAGLAAMLVVATAALAAASFRLDAFAGFLLATYTVAVGEIVLLTELLSFFDGVSATGYAAAEVCALAVAVALWSYRGRPRPPIPASIPRRSVPQHPALVLLGCAVVVAVGYQTFLVLATPPNNYDSLAYHLARAAEWYQRSAVEYYPSHSESVNAPQPNAEMLILFGFAFAHRDTFAAVPQLLAELACLVCVYGIAVRLGFSRAASTFASLLTATLSLVALQSVTTQNDLLLASLVAIALYFVLGRTTPELALAAVALGVALGTKATAVIAVPLLLAAALLVHRRRDVLRGAVLAGVAFALFGSYGYVLNVIHTGRPLGDPLALGPLQRTDPTFGGTVSTATRLSYNFVDLSGYPVPDAATSPFERAGARVFRVAHIPVNPRDATVLEPPIPSPFTFTVNRRAEETLSYFGPLGALLLPLSVMVGVAVARRRAPPLMLVPAAAIPAFVLGIAVATRYNEFNGRYLLPAIVLAMPMAAYVYSRRRAAAAIAGVGLLTLALAHIENEVKPTGAHHWRPAVWSMTRAEAQSINGKRLQPVLEDVERYVPTDGRLGYVLRYNDWIYPFYGESLERRLVLLPRKGLFDMAARKGLEAIIVAGPVLDRSDAWRAISYPDVPWKLFVRRSP